MTFPFVSWIQIVVTRIVMNSVWFGRLFVTVRLWNVQQLSWAGIWAVAQLLNDFLHILFLLLLCERTPDGLIRNKINRRQIIIIIIRKVNLHQLRNISLLLFCLDNKLQTICSNDIVKVRSLVGQTKCKTNKYMILAFQSVFKMYIFSMCFESKRVKYDSKMSSKQIVYWSAN